MNAESKEINPTWSDDFDDEGIWFFVDPKCLECSGTGQTDNGFVLLRCPVCIQRYARILEEVFVGNCFFNSDAEVDYMVAAIEFAWNRVKSRRDKSNESEAE